MIRHFIMGVLLIFSVQHGFSWAYDGEDHKEISEHVVSASNLNQVLIDHKGVKSALGSCVQR